MKNYKILIAICAITLLSTLTHSGGLAGIGKIILHDLHLSSTQLGGLLAVNHVGIMIFSGWAGYQSDRVPVLWLLMSGIILQFFAIIGFAYTSHYTLLLLLRILDGIGFSFINVAGTRELLRRYPAVNDRAKVLGIKSTIYPAAIMLGSVIIPYLSFWVTWRSAFLIASVGPVFALLLAISCFSFKSTPNPSRQSSLSLLQPLKIPSVWLLGAVGTICMLVQNGVLSFLSLFLQSTIQLSFTQSISYLTVVVLGGIVGRILIGYLTGKLLTLRSMLPTILGMTAVSLLLLASLPIHASSFMLLLLFILLGIALFGWYGSYVTLMNTLSSAASMGSFAGIATQFTALGAILGPSLLGLSIDFSGFRLSLIFLATLLLSTIVLIRLIKSQGSVYANRYAQ